MVSNPKTLKKNQTRNQQTNIVFSRLEYDWSKMLSNIPIDFQTKSKTNQNIQCQKNIQREKEI